MHPFYSITHSQIKVLSNAKNCLILKISESCCHLLMELLEVCLDFVFSIFDGILNKRESRVEKS